jgi:hypothetical protein
MQAGPGEKEAIIPTIRKAGYVSRFSLSASDCGSVLYRAFDHDLGIFAKQVCIDRVDMAALTITDQVSKGTRGFLGYISTGSISGCLYYQEVSHSKNLPMTRYILAMFPYPSGKLHLGHFRNYCLADIVARYHRMHKHYVINPIGWDSFGLPADNAAILYKIPPREWTDANIAQMKTAMETWDLSFDWDREISTCEPEYYKWTQWIFLKLFNRHMVVRTKTSVNWDPHLKTGNI